MADLAATDVTIVIGERQIADRKKRNKCSVAFGDGALTYPTGGVPMPAKEKFGMFRNLDHFKIIDPANANGYVYKYDDANQKLRIYQGSAIDAAQTNLTKVAAATVHTVTYVASPGGNQIYVKFGEFGAYLACNMANDTEDKLVKFGSSVYVVIKHDAGASSGNGSVALTFDDDGTQPDRLIADMSGGLADDAYVSTTDPRYCLKIKNAASGGTAIHFDDGGDERLEAANAGTADADTDLALIVVDPASVAAAPLVELAGSATPAAATLDVMAIGW